MTDECRIKEEEREMTDRRLKHTMDDSGPTARLKNYTCNVCDDTACECSTEGDIPPTRCCMQCIPSWRLGP